MERLAAALVVIGMQVSCSADSSWRDAAIIDALASADETLLRSRPRHVAGKYRTMAADPYNFWRGTVPLFRADCLNPLLEIGKTSSSTPLIPLAHGDPHVENFGTLEGADLTLALEPNDFDGADRLPYHWDLRRLTVGMVIAARLSNEGDPDARAAAIAVEAEAVHATATAYAEAIRGLAAGASRGPILEADAQSPLVRDLFRRALNDQESREELDELTEIEGGTRRLLRGALDTDEPQNIYTELPASVWAALPGTLEAYRQTLISPPDAGFFHILDAVREQGSGVASWPRVRMAILVRGPSDGLEDDVILELKELIDSGTGTFYPPFVLADTVQERVIRASRMAWARPDGEPLWGTSTLLGMPVQIKREAEMHKTLRVSRLEDEEGLPEAIIALGRELGGLLARVHATPIDGVDMASAIASAIGEDVSSFASEESRIALDYANLHHADYEAFQRLLASRGETLGLPIETALVSPDLAALYAVPVEPEEVTE